MNNIWTEDENKFVRRQSKHLTDEQMAVAFMGKFNRTMNKEQIRKHRQRLGIKKAGGRGVCMVEKEMGK